MSKTDIVHKMRAGWPKKPTRPMPPEARLAVKASIEYLKQKRIKEERDAAAEAAPF